MLLFLLLSMFLLSLFLFIFLLRFVNLVALVFIVIFLHNWPAIGKLNICNYTPWVGRRVGGLVGGLVCE